MKYEIYWDIIIICHWNSLLCSHLILNIKYIYCTEILTCSKQHITFIILPFYCTRIFFTIFTQRNEWFRCVMDILLPRMPLNSVFICVWLQKDIYEYIHQNADPCNAKCQFQFIEYVKRSGAEREGKTEINGRQNENWKRCQLRGPRLRSGCQPRWLLISLNCKQEVLRHRI